MKDYTIVDVLGRGGSSTVYRGFHNDRKEEEVLIKVFKSRRHSKNERNALKDLTDVPNVPSFVEHTKTIDNRNWVVVVKPVSDPVQPLTGGGYIFGQHLAAIVKVLQAAHKEGMYPCHPHARTYDELN